MCLECLNPCKIFEFAAGICCCLIFVVLFGYIGKGIYLYSGQEGVDVSEVVTDPNFYIPDLSFWVFGCVGVLLLFCLLVIIRAILVGVFNCTSKIVRRYCCICLCRACEDDTDDDLDSEYAGNRRRKNQNKHNQKTMKSYKKLMNVDMEKGEEDEEEDDIEMNDRRTNRKHKK